MIIENITSRGASITSSLSGNLAINENTGEITVRRDGSEVVRIDQTGFRYYDLAATERIFIGQNTAGQQQVVVYDANGRAIAVMGQDPKDGTPVIAVSESGEDVLESLRNA